MVVALTVVGLGLSLWYALHNFIITSDSLLEYQTYLIYTRLNWWRPITDNMLSTSLFTTYVPAVLQRLFQLRDPETVYRVWLAIVTVPSLPILYMTCRRYTTLWPSLVLAGIFATSFYYGTSTQHARILVAVWWGLLLVNNITSHSSQRYYYIAITAAGLLMSHYSTALLYTFMLAIAFGVSLIVAISLRRNRHCVLNLGLSVVMLIVGIAVYYAGIARYARVWNYSYAAFAATLEEVTGWRIPPSPAIVPPSDRRDYYTFPLPTVPNVSPVTEKIALVAENTTPIPQRRTSINPFNGLTEDFKMAHALILARAVIAVIILVALYRRNRWRDPLPYIYLAGVLIAVLGIFVAGIGQYLGSVRPAFISLPFELLGVAAWHNGEKTRSWALWILLGFLLFAYH